MSRTVLITVALGCGGVGLVAAASFTVSYIEQQSVRRVVEKLPHRFDLERCTLRFFCNNVSASIDLDGYPTLAACEEQAKKEVSKAEQVVPTSIVSSYKADCKYFGPKSVGGVKLP